MTDIFSVFSALQKGGEQPDSQNAFGVVRQLQDFITKTQYICTDEILLSLGEMYLADQRFQQQIDKNGAGTAAFASSAIKAYYQSVKKG